MSPRFLPTLALLAVCATGSACDGATAASPVVAEYALVTLSAAVLPAVPFEGAGVTILGDTIRLREDGTGVRDVRYMEGNTRALRGGRSALTWRAIGDSLEVSVVCRAPALADCLAQPHLAGRLSSPGRQWMIARAAIYRDVPAVYNPIGVR